MTAKELDDEALALVERIRPILAGRDPEVQSVALAQLLAMWVLGFHTPGDQEATIELQADLLDRHWQLVTDLIHLQADWALNAHLNRN